MSSVYGPAGNSSNKFGSKNPISQYLMNGFINSVKELVTLTKADSALEIGCGEGEIQKIIGESGFSSQAAFDIDLPIVIDAREKYAASNYFVANGERIPVPAKSFDLSMAIEVLEHVPEPDKLLAEMKRVTRSYVIISVPREPIWRILNFARGAYVSDFGNSPGHIQHWSSAGFVKMVARHFEIVQINKPLPWTMVLAKVGR